MPTQFRTAGDWNTCAGATGTGQPCFTDLSLPRLAFPRALPNPSPQSRQSPTCLNCLRVSIRHPMTRLVTSQHNLPPSTSDQGYLDRTLAAAGETGLPDRKSLRSSSSRLSRNRSFPSARTHLLGCHQRQLSSDRDLPLPRRRLHKPRRTPSPNPLRRLHPTHPFTPLLLLVASTQRPA